MASATLIPIREYLRTTYRPDCDFLDGEVKERNMGEQPHAHVQAILASVFRDHRVDWQVRGLTEQRVQVTPTRFRIPDICVLRRSDPKDPIITVAPLLCIEVLCKDDTLNELQQRVNDYAAPENGVLRVEGTPIAVTLTDIFAELDED